MIDPDVHADSQTPLPPPAGAAATVRDTCGNFWSLAPAQNGRCCLLLLPAQKPSEWTTFSPTGPAEVSYATSLSANADGTITLAEKSRAWSFDPRHPERSVTPIAPRLNGTESSSPWRVVSRMPASNHDLTAAVLGEKLYVAGGITADWGFPTRSHAFNKLWQLDARTWTWGVAATFSTPRIYCATVTFAERIWIAGGDLVHADGQRRATINVNIFDPRTGTLTTGPALPFAQPQPLALVACGRLYVMGTPKTEAPGRMDSIGPGESTWRREPDGPPHMWALAGATLDEKLYVSIPQIGLATFDPATARWEILGGPTRPRSPQIAAWRGELWIMGGRDVADQSETHIFDPRTRAWRNGPSLPRELAWGAAAVVRNQLVVTGGAAGPGYNDRTFVLSAP